MKNLILKGGDRMGESARLDRKTVLSLVRFLGVREEDSHLEELYAYVERLFPNFKVSENLDLKETEPMLTFVLPEE